MDRGFHDHGLMMRITADTIALSPPLIVTEDQIGEIMDKLAKVIRAVA
jgi:beta-alanine--pyruvate transaminase